MTELTIQVGDRSLSGTWLERNEETRATLIDTMPIAGTANKWGDELYLHIDVAADPTDTTSEVDPGTIAYWPDGPAICVFWGPTPASTDDKPVAASPVAPVAMLDSWASLETVEGGTSLRIAVG